MGRAHSTTSAGANSFTAEALRIADDTRKLLAKHRRRLKADELLDEFIDRAHRDALAEIPEAALRLRVALALSCKGTAADAPESY
jgi:hypothetical protein